MKSLTCAFLLFTFVSVTFGQCDPTISPNDHVADVKGKLACFVAENTKLKQELATRPGDSASRLRIVRVYGGTYQLKNFGLDSCIKAATAGVTKRGGNI